MNFYLTVFFDWILTSSVMASVFVAFIFLAKLFLKDKLSPRWTYCLWILLVLRLLLPWAPESSLSVFNIVTIENQEFSQKDLRNGVKYGSPMAANFEQSNHNQSSVFIDQSNLPIEGSIVNRRTNWFEQVSIMQILSWVWFIGTLLVLIKIVVVNIGFGRKIKNEPTLLDKNILTVFNQCKDEIRMKQNVSLIRSNLVTSPTLFGIIHPKLLMPEIILNTLSKDQLRYVFLHELSHAKRNDIAMNWLMSLLLTLHWFNPLLWFGYHKMRSDQELACDSFVLKRLNKEESSNYALTMIKLLEVFVNPVRLTGAASISGSKKELMRRIIMIKSFKKYSYKSTLLGIAVILLLSGCALTSPKTEDNQLGTTHVTIPDEDHEKILDLATIWANALITRDGEPRYEMMSEKAKEKFEQEQITRSGTMNFNIGVSSPWVVDFEIEIGKMTATITYVTQTSEPAYYNEREVLTFVKENNKIVVDDYQMDENINPVTEPKTVAGYIVLEDNTLYLDEVEVITTEEADRISGLYNVPIEPDKVFGNLSEPDIIKDR